MKVLLIGGTGILSTDIVKECLKKKYDVYLFNRGHNNSEINEKVHIIIGDIRNEQDVAKKMENYYFDVVVDFLSYTENELKQNLKIFNERCKQYIFISSATVYRKTKKGEKITEETELSNDSWDYANNKIKCEKLLKSNYKEQKQKYTIVRPYVTYSEKRIPFAIIPSKQWTLANRILNGKPILLWDSGKAICTLTQTKDFAVGIVGLFLNEKAYQEAFHITTDYTLTWKQALLDIGKALNMKVKIADIDSDFIAKKMPEYKGVLFGDKGLDREFDNTKIKNAVPEFKANTKFQDGIKETINYYQANKQAQKIDYLWDGRIDSTIRKYYNKNKVDYEKRKLSIKSYAEKLSIENKIKYYIGYNNVLYNLYKIIKKLVRK